MYLLELLGFTASEMIIELTQKEIQYHTQAAVILYSLPERTHCVYPFACQLQPVQEYNRLPQPLLFVFLKVREASGTC